MTFRDDRWSEEFSSLQRRIRELEIENASLLESLASEEVKKLKEELAVLKRDHSQIQQDLDLAKKIIDVMNTALVVTAKGMEGRYSLQQVKQHLKDAAVWIRAQRKI